MTEDTLDLKIKAETLRWNVYYEMGQWFGEAKNKTHVFCTFGQPSAERVAAAIDTLDYYAEEIVCIEIEES